MSKPPQIDLFAYKNIHAGKNIFILNRGPSWKKVCREVVVKLKANGGIIAAVKSGIEGFEDLVDIHFVNQYNHQRYRYSRSHTVIKVLLNIPGEPRIWDTDYDLVFRLPDVPIDCFESSKKNTLAVKMDFDRGIIRDSLDRPWGPGIMYDIVIFFCLYLGAKNLVISGWDLTATAGAKDENDAFLMAQRAGAMHTRAVNPLKAKLAESPVGGLLKTANLFRKHLSGKPYNIVGVTAKFEEDCVIKSSGAFYEWLQTRGVGLYLDSDISRLSPTIPRTRFEDWL